MSTKNNGGPAFPRPVSRKNPIDPSTEQPAQEGMTLRDWFAGMAMQGICANPENDGMNTGDAVLRAYQAADAMIDQRDK